MKDKIKTLEKRAQLKGYLPPHAVVMVDPQASPQSLKETLKTNIVSIGETLPPSHSSVSVLDQIASELSGCQRCKLCQKRTHIVFGEGNPQARLAFVGEGPGEQEDRQGRPFVGKAGQLLDRMIQAMGLQRQDVYICNVVKCRPPMNRNPEPDEVASCSPFLYRQLDAIRPEVIVALGKFAAQTLLQTERRISELRGKIFKYPHLEQTKLIPTFHPSFLLRNPAAKREAWDDLKKAAFELGLELPRSGRSGPAE